MKRHLISLLECPVCHHDLTWNHVDVVAAHDASIVWKGEMQCVQGHAYDVRNGCAMLRAEDQHAPRESGNASPASVDLPTGKELQTILQQKIRAILLETLDPGPTREKRIVQDFDYRLNSTNKKTLRLLSAFSTVDVVCDLGLGQGGFLTEVRTQFSPEHAIGVEYDPRWAEIASLRDPQTSVLVADGRNLPMKDHSIDLLVSVYALEHIPGWEAVIREVRRTTRHAVLLFGPNKWFPIDLGHALAIPGIPMMPLFLRASILTLAKKLRGDRVSYAKVRKEQEEMAYLSAGQFEREVRAQGLRYQDRFMEYVDIVLDEGFNYWKFLRILRTLAPLTRGVLRVLNTLRVHPIHVYQLEQLDV